MTKVSEWKDKLLHEFIGRTVVVLTALLLPIVGKYVVVINNALPGANLNADAIVAVVVTATLGVAAAVYKWLSNRGEYERLKHELEIVLQSGENLRNQGVEPAPVPEPVDPEVPTGTLK